MADKLLFILTDLKQNPIQAVQGQLFGMSQSHANKWIHVLHPVLTQAFADQELLPARTADAVAVMLAQQPPEGPSAVPRCGMLGPNARSSAQKIPRSSKSMTVARRSVIRSKTSSCSMRPVTCAS
jgi:hypothetical protein